MIKESERLQSKISEITAKRDVAAAESEEAKKYADEAQAADNEVSARKEFIRYKDAEDLVLRYDGALEVLDKQLKDALARESEEEREKHIDAIIDEAGKTIAKIDQKAKQIFDLVDEIIDICPSDPLL